MHGVAGTGRASASASAAATTATASTRRRFREKQLISPWMSLLLPGLVKISGGGLAGVEHGALEAEGVQRLGHVLLFCDWANERTDGRQKECVFGWLASSIFDVFLKNLFRELSPPDVVTRTKPILILVWVYCQ